jgi:tRNA(adenine34) deaminase
MPLNPAQSQPDTAAHQTTFMELALAEAANAAARGEVPVGAVIIGADATVVARAGNRTRELNDPTAHAEILAIRAACESLGVERLLSCDLYVTLEPCPMCAGAISAARLRRLYYAASDAKSGGVEAGARVFSHATCHHVPEVYPGLGERQAVELLRQFFVHRR